MAIHPKWEIEEKARIFRICVWFSPIQPPRAADMIAMEVSRVGFNEWCVMNNRVIGGNFMTVERIKPVVSGDPCRTSGNQKWNGAIPSFMAMADVRIRQEVGCVIWVMSHCPMCHALVMLENRIKAEAVAWVRKYLVAASIARGWWDFEISGRMDRVLISNPAQTMIQWLLVMVIVVPSSRLKMKISFAWGFISRGRGKPSFSGYGPDSLFS